MPSSRLRTGGSPVHIRVIIYPYAFRMFFFCNYFFICIIAVFSLTGILPVSFRRTGAVCHNRLPKLMSQSWNFIIFHYRIADRAGISIGPLLCTGCLSGNNRIAFRMSFCRDSSAFCVSTACTPSCFLPRFRTGCRLCHRPASKPMPCCWNDSGFYCFPAGSTLLIDMSLCCTSRFLHNLLIITVSCGTDTFRIVRTANCTGISRISVTFTGFAFACGHYINVIMRNNRNYLCCKQRITVCTSALPKSLGGFCCF